MIRLPMPGLNPLGTIANIIAPITIGLGIVTVLKHYDGADTTTLVKELAKTIGLIAIPLFLSYAIGYPAMVILFGLYQLDQGYVRQLALDKNLPTPLPLPERAAEYKAVWDIMGPEHSVKDLENLLKKLLQDIQNPVDKFHTALRLGNMIPCTSEMGKAPYIILSIAFKALFGVPRETKFKGKSIDEFGTNMIAHLKQRGNPLPIPDLHVDDILAFATLCKKYSGGFGKKMAEYITEYTEHCKETPTLCESEWSLDRLGTMAQMYRAMDPKIQDTFESLRNKIDAHLSAIIPSTEQDRLKIAYVQGLLVPTAKRTVLGPLFSFNWSNQDFSLPSLQEVPTLIAAGYFTYPDPAEGKLPAPDDEEPSTMDLTEGPRFGTTEDYSSLRPKQPQPKQQKAAFIRAGQLFDPLNGEEPKRRHGLVSALVNQAIEQCLQNRNLNTLNTTIMDVLRLMYEYTLLKQIWKEKGPMHEKALQKALEPPTQLPKCYGISKPITQLCEMITALSDIKPPIDMLLTWYTLSASLITLNNQKDQGAKNQIIALLTTMIADALNKELQDAEEGLPHTAAETLEQIVKATHAVGDYGLSQVLILRYIEKMKEIEHLPARAHAESQHLYRQGGFVMTISGIAWTCLRLACSGI